MDYDSISPKYVMSLISQVHDKIWELYKTYEDVKFYVLKWHEDYGNFDENFPLAFKDDNRFQLNLKTTLHSMPANILVRVAIDLGIETPGYLPAIATFRNVLLDQNQSAYQNFDRAVKNVYEQPDLAVALASSALEGLIKAILSHDTFNGSDQTFRNKSLSKLVVAIVKEFGFDDKTRCPPELQALAGKLRSIGSSIDDLRSDKSSAHGKAAGDYVVDDPLWASFAVNTTASVGLFLWEYFEKKYKPEKKRQSEEVPDLVGINLDDIPF
jgi:Abortive infection C-terminus